MVLGSLRWVGGVQVARPTLRGEKGEGVAELASFNRKMPGMGHLTKVRFCRTMVVWNREDIASFFVGFYARKTTQGFWGCFGVHLTSQEGAQGAQVM